MYAHELLRQRIRERFLNERQSDELISELGGKLLKMRFADKETQYKLMGYNPTKSDAVVFRYGNVKGITFDYALPQPVLNRIQEVTGIYCTMFVYAYGEDGKEGFLPLDNEAAQLLEIYKHITGIDLLF